MSTSGNRIYDAIIVGAGHNGLTAACYLARAGLSTLVLERRDIVGGCCVTEEIAPGCRASTTSYIASMLRPEVIRDLKLAEHGLRMVPCDPALQVPFPDGHLVSWWAERERVVAELRKISVKDAETFVRVDDQLKKLARYLQPFFLEPPPEVDTKSLGGWGDLLRDGKRGGPYQPGTALGLLFHLLSGGEHELQGFYGHVMGGMGAITGAMAAAARGFGADIVTNAPVAGI